MPEHAVSIDYIPFRRQREFHALRTEVAGYFGGWGSGKTRAALAEAYRNTCYQPGVPVLLASPTFPIQRKTMWRELVQVLPGASRWPRGQDGAQNRVQRCLGPMVREWNSRDRVLTLNIGDPKSPVSRGGTDWYFGSLEDPGSIEGGTYGSGVLDEPRLVSREGWEIFNSRIRDPRAKVLRRSVTGVPSMGWMDEEFNRGAPGRSFVRGSSDDNPYLPPGYVQQLNLSGRKAQAFRHGMFVHLEGTVYDDYMTVAQGDDAGSIIDVRPEPTRATYGFLDFGRKRPYFGLMQQIAPGAHPAAPWGGDVVVEELVAVDMREPVHAERCALLCKRLNVQMLDVWCDPAGTTPNSQTGLPSMQVYESAFRKHGVLVGGLRYTTNPIERYKPNRVDAVSARLLGADGVRRLFVAQHLAEPQRADYGSGVAGIHRALLGLTYPKNRPGDNRPVKDGVNDHPCDALEYLVVGLYGVIEAPDVLALNTDAPSADSPYGFGRGSDPLGIYGG